MFCPLRDKEWSRNGCAFCFNLWDSINTSVKRSMAKLYKIKLVKQQSFNFSHNLLKRCLVLRQDYVEKWQGQFSSFSFQAHAQSKSERSVLVLKMGPFRRVTLNTVLFLSLIWLP